MRIGTINITTPLALAPMEDVSDAAFRMICKRLGADLVYTEFTSSDALIRNIPKALDKIKISEEERPAGIQIFGANETTMSEAARMAEQFQPDLIDINCGCWVKNHVARGQGAALLKDLPRMEKIIKATVQATTLPVTVKTRLGWDRNSIVIEDVARMVEQSGAQALTVHCRTRSQAYKDHADWHWLEKIKKAVRIPIFGNGDVTTPEDAKKMLETGCDGVMIGRGAIGNPWIFQQTKHFLKTGQHLPDVTLKEKIDLCIKHLNLATQLKSEQAGIIPFRKYYIGYLKGIPNVAKLRSDLMKMTGLKTIINRLNQFLEENKP